MDEQEKKLNKVKELLKMVDESITRAEFEAAFEKVIEIVKQIKKGNEKEFGLIHKNIVALGDKLRKENASSFDDLKVNYNAEVSRILEQVNVAVQGLRDSVIQGRDGKDGADGEDGRDGKDADEGAILTKLSNQLPQLGERVRDGLELLQGEERLDASAIKNLPEFTKEVVTRAGWGAHPLMILDNGDVVDKVARRINFVNATITRDNEGTIEIDVGAGGGGYTNLTQFVDQTAWRVFYSDGNGDVKELALGADGTFFKSNGAAVAPSFATPAGSGDVIKVGTPANNQVGVWTGDGTIEGDANFTWSGSVLALVGDVTVSDDPYDAGTWDGNFEVPTKNAIRDKIEAMAGGSGITRTVVSTVGSITLGSSASTDYVYFVTGAHTMSMPAPNTNRYTIKNNHSAAITVDTLGAELIEGAASISVDPEDSVDVVSDGTDWYVV